MSGKRDKFGSVQRARTFKSVLVAYSIPCALAVLGLLVSAWTGVHFRELNLLKTNDFIQKRFEKTIDQINGNFASSIDVLTAVNGIFLASEEVTREEFNNFSSMIIERHAYIEGLLWAPRVSQAERKDHEQRVQNDGFSNHLIYDGDHGVPIQVSPEREFHYPILYVTPFEGVYRNVLGIDLLNGTEVSPALKIAISTNRPAVSAKMKLPPAEKKQTGVLAFFPISVAGADESLRNTGVTSLVVNIEKLFESVFADMIFDTAIVIRDVSNPKFEEVLYSNEITKKDVYEEFGHIEIVKFLDRSWEVALAPTRALMRSKNSLEPWIIFILGALFSVLSALALAWQAKQKGRVDAIVAARTLELQHANQELEEFAYRSSHDLRSPLISSIRLIEFAKESMGSGDIAFADKSLSHVEKSLRKLESLVKDILVLAKTKNQAEEDREIDVEKLIKLSIEQVEHLENFERVDFQLSFDHKGQLKTKEGRLRLVVENLISNAIKYQDISKSGSFIKIKTNNVDGSFVLEVIDNGIGIPEHKRAQVFQMFQRFHGNVSFGSGLGLYMIQKSAAIMGGKIEYDDSHNYTCFRLSLPLI